MQTRPIWAGSVGKSGSGHSGPFDEQLPSQRPKVSRCSKRSKLRGLVELHHVEAQYVSVHVQGCSSILRTGQARVNARHGVWCEHRTTLQQGLRPLFDRHGGVPVTVPSLGA